MRVCLVSKLFIFCGALLFCAATHNPVHAQNQILDIEVTANLSTNNIRQQIDFKVFNGEQDQVLKSVELEVPYSQIDNLTVTNDGNKIPSSSKQLQPNRSRIRVDLSQLIIKSGHTVDLKLNYSTNRPPDTYNFTFLDPFLAYPYSIRVNFPAGWGEPNLTHEYQQVELGTNTVYASKVQNSFGLQWDYDTILANLDTDIIGGQQPDEEILVPLPRATNNQQLKILDVGTSDRAWQDFADNLFLAFNTGDEGQMTAKLELHKSIGPITTEYLSSYQHYSVPDSDDTFSIESATNLVISKLDPQIDSKPISIGSDATQPASSLEYCKYLTSIANSNPELTSRIVYGTLNDPTLNIPGRFHVWCEISDGDEIVVVDPWLADAWNFPPIANNHVGRVAWGYYLPDLPLDTLSKQGLTIPKLSFSQTEQTNSTYSRPISTQLYCPNAVDYQAKEISCLVELINNTDMAIPISEIQTSTGEVVLSTDSRKWTKAILPGTTELTVRIQTDSAMATEQAYPVRLQLIPKELEPVTIPTQLVNIRSEEAQSLLASIDLGSLNINVYLAVAVSAIIIMTIVLFFLIWQLRRHRYD